MQIARSKPLCRLEHRVSGGSIATRLYGSAIVLGPALCPSRVLLVFV